LLSSLIPLGMLWPPEYWKERYPCGVASSKKGVSVREILTACHF
jgi:hypothetical protein